MQGACLPHAAALSPWQICAFRLALTAGNCSGRGYSRLRARSDGVAIGLSLPTAHLLLNGRARRSTGNASKKKWQERKHEPTQRNCVFSLKYTECAHYCRVAAMHSDHYVATWKIVGTGNTDYVD